MIKHKKITCPLLREFITSLHKLEERPAKGFLTVNQWAEKWGYEGSHTARILRHLLKAGKVECRRYRVKDASTHAPVPKRHYGPPVHQAKAGKKAKKA